MAITHLLYLHGFRSSPQSVKAQKMAALVAARYPDIVWWCPQLPPSPRDAMALLTQGVAGWPRMSMAVIGSSLGGFYATAVAERCGCKAVLLNPAVDPARDLAAYIGEQTTWQNPDAHFFFEAHFVDELRALQAGPLTTPQNYLAVIAKGDEVLDWREIVGTYPQARKILEEGGDHAMGNFGNYVPEITQFLQLR